ncbi:MAG: AsmA protein [Variibacter sp.]|nr:AsmA protein [Variibacter sp.]
MATLGLSALCPGKLVQATRGLKRFGIAVIGIMATALAVVLAMPFVIRAEAVRDAVQSEIRNATGFEPILRGTASFSAFPWGSASFADVVLTDGVGTPPLSSERLAVRLRFLPLLLGRVEIAELSLVRPHILIEIDRNGQSNWNGLLESLNRRNRPAQSNGGDAVSFSEIRMLDGSLEIKDSTRGYLETLEDVDVSLAWPAISRNFTATGSFIWRSERVDGSASLSDFRAALMGERSGLKLRFAAPLLKLAFDGHLGRRPTFKLEGTLAADSTSLRDATRWAARTSLPQGGFGRFALKAQASVVGGTIALSKVNVEVDGNSAEGVLTLVTEHQASLQGTLAAETLDLSPYVAAVQLSEGDRDWSRLPITSDSFGSLEFDLRLSAGKVSVAGATVGRTAIATSYRDGRFNLNIGESHAFGGNLKGSLAMARGQNGADVRAQLNFTEVDLDTSINALFGIRRLEGRGDISLMAEASGSTVLGLTRTLNGSGALVAERGAVTGVNVEQLLRRLERRPLSGSGDYRSGRTPFEKLAISMKIVDGVASVEEVRLEGPAVKLALGGSAAIPTRDLDLKGTASLMGSNAKEQGFELPFVVRGRWDDPVMLPDAQSLIRRSGAAAPLLDAARGGRAREAVRSAIDELTRTGGEPAQPDASAPAEPASTVSAPSQ